MSKLFQKLGRTRTPTAAGGAAPRLTLAIFGKHPGWDDHMPGLGVETETLACLKQTLYVTGIGRQIDSGAWEKLEADKRQEGFDHTFLWLRAGHVVLGLLWSSKDGKGRSMYPMVLCVDGEGVSPALLLDKVRPGLAALRDACKAATTAEQVASNWRAAQEQLWMLFAGSAPQPDLEQPVENARRFLAHVELGPDRLGLLRVLHELSGASGLAGDTRPGARGGAAAPSLHIRVPWAADSQDSALLLWAEFLHSAISADITLVLMARGQADWLDVVVGEPKADDFFFLQASQKGFPLVTQIPYELSPHAMARLREVEFRFSGEEPTTVMTAAKASTPAPPPLPKAPPPILPPAATAPAPASPSTTQFAKPVPPAIAKTPAPAPPPVAKAPPPAPPPIAPRAENAAPSSRRNGVLAAIGVVVLLIVAFLVWMPHNPTGDQNQKAQPQDEQAKQPPDQTQRQRDGASQADPYQLAMKGGRGALAREDYTEATAQADKALAVKPGDAAAQQLRAEAQAKETAASQKEAAYQAAMQEGSAALERDDYEGASAQADKALALKPDDAAAKKLGEDAQVKRSAALQKEAAYQEAMKEGRAALERNDYDGASAQAKSALALKPDDAAAKKLGEDAQAERSTALQKEIDYQAAMKAGRAALERDDYDGASAQAKSALALKTDDAAAKKLSEDAQAKRSAAMQKEAAYQSSLKEGRAALERDDYNSATALADKALALKPEDAAAKQLHADAQAKQAAALANEAGYEAAIKGEHECLARGDYRSALAQAEKALVFKPNDADARQLRDEAKNKLSGIGLRLFTNSIKMEFVLVPGLGAGGAFLGKYEVTERQYRTIMGQLPEGEVPAEGDMPVVGVTFPQAVRFCDELSKREKKHYSLPTRQQWLAAAALPEDQVTNAWDILSASGALEHEATSLNNPPRSKPAAVGSMGAGAYGLCDMLGNVREWVSEQQRAGFSFQSRKGGRTEELFLPGSQTDSWIVHETGLRCLLRESPAP